MRHMVRIAPDTGTAARKANLGQDQAVLVAWGLGDCRRGDGRSRTIWFGRHLCVSFRLASVGFRRPISFWLPILRFLDLLCVSLKVTFDLFFSLCGSMLFVNAERCVLSGLYPHVLM